MGRRWRMAAWPTVCTFAVLGLTSVSIAINGALSGSMYTALSQEFDLGPTQLTLFDTANSLSTSLFSPVAGVLGDRFHRGFLIAVGTLLWSAFSFLFGFTKTFSQGVAWMALMGFGVALTGPASSSILADMFPESSRGTAFGLMYFISGLGTLGGGAWAVNAANQGWRLTFMVSAGLGALTGLAAFPGIWEPRNGSRAAPRRAAVHAERPPAARRRRWRPSRAAFRAEAGRIARDAWRVVRVPSFLVLLVEHVTDLTGGVSGFAVQYFQFLGFSDGATSVITSVWSTIGAQVGLVLGGVSGDLLARRFPIAARPATNQVSIALVMPLVYVGYKVMPGCARYATGVAGTMDYLTWRYSLLNFVTGALQSWCAANNSTIYAEVIPPSRRSLAYALDSGMSGLIKSCTIPVAGLVIERLGGHAVQKVAAAAGAGGDDAAAPAPAVAPADNLANARAIEDGLLYLILISYGVKIFIYHALYYTMPRDRLVEEAEEEDESDAAPPAPPLEPRPSALELLPHSALAPKDSATSLPAAPAKDLPPPPC